MTTDPIRPPARPPGMYRDPVQPGPDLTEPAAELARANAILREHGFDYPMGLTASGVAEALEMLESYRQLAAGRDE